MGKSKLFTYTYSIYRIAVSSSWTHQHKHLFVDCGGEKYLESEWIQQKFSTLRRALVDSMSILLVALPALPGLNLILGLDCLYFMWCYC